MEKMQKIKSIKTIMVTNTRSFSDNSSVAADLAVMIAQNGKKVALVDANLRRPIIHTIFQLPNRVGLSDILQNHRSPLAIMHDREDRLPGFPTENNRLLTIIQTMSRHTVIVAESILMPSD